MIITDLQFLKFEDGLYTIAEKTKELTILLSELKGQAVRIPPLFKQCDEPWGQKPYSDQSGNTHCYSGCLVSAFASLVHWNWKHADTLSVNPERVARKLNENGAFVGPYLSHPSRVGYDMMWYKKAPFWSPRYDCFETSKVDYTQRPADVQLIANILERHPVVALLDYYPRDGENDIDAHFVLMYKYIPDPTGGLNDDALIMDPMRGYTSILHYFNPDWDNQWMVDNEVSRVARIVCGLRVWEPKV